MVKWHMHMNSPKIDNSTILITGGTGSWGHELTKQLLEKYNPKEIRIYSRNELRQVEMKREFNDPRVKFIIGDVRDYSRLLSSSRGVDYIFHLAALKHVTVCEENPWEAVQTNIIGTQNVVNACLENGIKKMIDVSTDKAVDPLNLYGVCKACGERLTINGNTAGNGTSFVCIRGGNVLGTTGSVIPLFIKQIKELNMVTLTDERMTRFWLSLPEAIGLVFKAFFESVGGETFAMKMPASYMKDLAEVMVEELGNKETQIRTIGIRPGEKIDEVLVSKYESSRTIDLGEYFAVLPLIKMPLAEEYYKDKQKIDITEFSSRTTKILNKKEIKEILTKNGFLSKERIEDELISSLNKGQLKRIENKEKWVI